MKKLTPTLRMALTALAAGTLLAACNGDNDEVSEPGPPPQAVIPDSALASATAYAEYARTLSNSDTDLPVDISKVNLAPTSETAEPLAL